MGAPIPDHIGIEFGLVHLTGLGTGDSDPDRDLVFHQIGQIIIGAVSGCRFDGHIPAGIGSFYPIVDEKTSTRCPLDGRSVLPTILVNRCLWVPCPFLHGPVIDLYVSVAKVLC